MAIIIDQQGQMITTDILSEEEQQLINLFASSRGKALFVLLEYPCERQILLRYIKDVLFTVLKTIQLQDAWSKLQKEGFLSFDSIFLNNLKLKRPMVDGQEYITEKLLENWIKEFLVQLNIEANGLNLRDFAKHKFHNLLHLGDVYFHLAENKKDQELPFAFLVTFTTSVEGQAVKHLPLSHALKKFAKEKDILLNLLRPIQKTAHSSELIKNLISSKKIYKPQFWPPSIAIQFLRETEAYLQNGITVKIPEWWNKNKPPRVKLAVSVESKTPSKLGIHSLVRFNLNYSLGGKKLTEAEWEEILAQNEDLVLLNGRWVEVNRDILHQTMHKWKQTQELAASYGISFIEALQILSKAKLKEGDLDVASGYESIKAGPEFRDYLSRLKDPKVDASQKKILDRTLNATLRPYQEVGVAWMWALRQGGLGGCLADDMGLGKTIQVIGFLLLCKSWIKSSQTLLIVPTSLMANWESELKKFAPSLRFVIFHSYDPRHQGVSANDIVEFDLIITTYGSLDKFDILKSHQWQQIFLDEAQAIKNSHTKQTKMIKTLQSECKFLLTGTPVENKIDDLWSLFDFSVSGLLGNKKQFVDYIQKIAESDQRDYGALRKLISPFILRRLKTDKKIITDLPEKMERKIFCILTKKQSVLYQQQVDELKDALKDNEMPDVKRKGLVLTYLMKLKQICNHPSQFLQNEDYKIEDSGKFMEFISICHRIKSANEKLIIFTQFRDVISTLDSKLSSLFGQKGYVIHGSVSAKQRKEMVESFQSENGAPYFILSLKAGGTGLNLVQANHVIHFDRWWNPAIENQATDRAFRIGQQKNVLVHKLIVKGTIEEKIDEIIEDKKSLADDLINKDFAQNFVNLSNEDLIGMLSLQS